MAPSLKKAIAPAEPTATILIALDQIEPSKSNPRKRFDEEAIGELATSIKEFGVLQAILVRPTYRTKTGAVIASDGYAETVAAMPGLAHSATYELVAGERRWRAAKLAGLTQIPATVRHLDDRQVLLIQVVENEERADTSPMEKAEGYGRLIEEHGLTAEAIAAKIGKSKATIYGLLKLRQLPEKARKALDAGDLSPSAAQLIARLPSPKARDQVTRFALQTTYNDGDPPTVADLKYEIQEKYMVELKGSPFDHDDARLLPAVGSCTACPRRTGNNRADFPDGRADVCTDPDCYGKKVQAVKKQILADAARKGLKILEGPAAAEFFDWAGMLQTWRIPYYDLADECPLGKKGQTYGQLLLPALEFKVVVAVNKEGRVFALVPKSAADAHLKAIDLAPKKSPADTRDDQAAAKRRAADNPQERILAETHRRLNELAAARAEALAAQTLSINAQGVEFLRLLTAGLADMVWSDSARVIMKRRQPDQPKNKFVADKERLAKLALTLDGHSLLGLLAECVAARFGPSRFRDFSRQVKPFFQALGIDQAKVKAQAVEHCKPAAKAKPSTNGKLSAPAQSAMRGTSAQEELVALGLLDEVTPPITCQVYDEALRRAMDSCIDFRDLSGMGATDDQIRDALVRHFRSLMRGGESYGHSGRIAWCIAIKGKAPSFWFDHSLPIGKPTLQGKDLIAQVRRLRGIKPPSLSPSDRETIANFEQSKRRPKPALQEAAR